MFLKCVQLFIQIFFLSIACSCTPASLTTSNIPVFPSAEGFGTQTPAGRGGRVIKVTNLENSGPGSLRAAIEFSGPRIIAFEVSGTISVIDKLTIKHPFITIAGQTAPSPGITIKGAGITVSTHDVLIQHLRIRIGDDPDGPNQSDRDCIQLKKSDSIYNVVIDHISASWGVDENISTWGSLHDVTISNSIISEALKNSLAGHPRGYGLLIGDHAKNVTVVKNLFAHNRDRNPLLKGDTTSIIVNNLIYNAGPYYFGYMGDGYNSGPIKTILLGNVFIEGKDSKSTPGFVARENLKHGSELYMKDNIYKGNGILFKNKASFDPIVRSPPIWDSSLMPMNTSHIEENILANAGARPADRDPVDIRIIQEVSTNTGKQIDSQNEIGGWPSLQSNYRPFVISSDYNSDDDGDGYTNLEEVLHQMSAAVEGKPYFPENGRTNKLKGGKK